MIDVADLLVMIICLCILNIIIRSKGRDNCRIILLLLLLRLIIIFIIIIIVKFINYDTAPSNPYPSSLYLLPSG